MSSVGDQLVGYVSTPQFIVSVVVFVAVVAMVIMVVVAIQNPCRHATVAGLVMILGVLFAGGLLLTLVSPMLSTLQF